MTRAFGQTDVTTLKQIIGEGITVTREIDDLREGLKESVDSVAKEMGIKEIPCLELDLDYDKERELNVRLNKNTGDWDFDLLANHFDIDELIDWGFDNKELTGLGEMILPDEKALEEPEINMNVIVTLEMTKERYFELKDQINSMEKDGVTINIS